MIPLVKLRHAAMISKIVLYQLLNALLVVLIVSEEMESVMLFVIMRSVITTIMTVHMLMYVRDQC